MTIAIQDEKDVNNPNQPINSATNISKAVA
jgi:hypothetical protein